MKLLAHTILAAVTLAVAIPSAASAQATGNATDGVTAPVPHDKDTDFPWGLLGVIGLAGLLGGRRHDNVHVNRPDNVTGV